MASPEYSHPTPVGLAPQQLTHAPGTCSRFILAKVGWEFYDSVMNGFGFPPKFPDGHVCQFTGPADDELWFMANCWISVEHAERYFRDEAMPIVQQLLIESNERPDIEPDALVVESFVLGTDAIEFCLKDTDTDGAAVRAYGHTPVLLVSNATTIALADYEASTASLGLPDAVPPGLIANVRGQTSDGDWFAYDVWKDIETAGGASPSIATTAQRIPMRRIAVNPAYLARSGIVDPKTRAGDACQ